MFDPARARRLVVYGGTFDPPHRAHVELPRRAAERLDADGVLYVPAGRPPHKPDRPITSAAHRLAMLKLALAAERRAAICEYELNQAGPSYTYRTLEHLHQTLGESVEMRLLIGADMALIFDQWKRPDVIERIAEPAVMVRPPHGRAALLDALGEAERDRWDRRIVELPAMAVSSSAIRASLAGGADMRRLGPMLDPAVADYIRENGLYRADNDRRQ
jgi:nicotinate-nucleotide adenylyltransferase